MAIKRTHGNQALYQFCTFTCYKWLPLIEETDCYDSVYKWFAYLHFKQIGVTAFVIMPNHVHVLLYFPAPDYNLNSIIGNAKRFLAYAIIKQLKETNNTALIKRLQEGVTNREKQKGQLHKVFEESFDAKPIYTEAFFQQKLNYIHHNPVSGKWNLVSDYTTYAHSSAAYYETGIAKGFIPFDYRKEEAGSLRKQAGSPLASRPGSEDPA
jgi:REP element-mobilizing transposase RayT